VSGAAEADFDLGMHVNLDGTRALLDTLRAEGRRPKFVFASSVAVFGGTLPEVVTDETTPGPQSSYGVQKLIGELLVGDCTRKGFIDGRAVRLPTIVVRPGKPNAAASSFASGIIREPLAGVEAVCPVDPRASMWLMSPRAAIANLVHAHELPAGRWTGPRSLSLPGITVSIASMLDALARVGGEAARGRVKMQPDPRIQAIVQGWPARFDTARADAMGFVRDGDFESIVRDYAKEYVR
jgi:nucleoside-diphosphate-sugar epimerase